jgi:hypothetical protein
MGIREDVELELLERKVNAISPGLVEAVKKQGQAVEITLADAPVTDEWALQIGTIIQWLCRSDFIMIAVSPSNMKVLGRNEIRI